MEVNSRQCLELSGTSSSAAPNRLRHSEPLTTRLVCRLAAAFGWERRSPPPNTQIQTQVMTPFPVWVHEFSNILSVLQGYTDLLKQHCEDFNSPVRKLATALAEVTDRARRLVAELPHLNDASTGEEAVDANLIIDRAVQMLSALMDAAGIHLVVQTAPEPLWVKARSAALDLVAMNLLINARDATPAGGLVLVRTYCSDDRPSPPALEEPQVLFEVTDSGHGMEPEVAVRAFEPYFSTKPEKGLGLGLFLSKTLVESLGGTMAFRSEPSKGTTFLVSLPKAAAPHVPAIPDAIAADPAAPPVAPLIQQTPNLPRTERGRAAASEKSRVMVVDDEQPICEILSSLLETQGYEVATFPNAVAALQALPSFSPDIILLDVIMPSMSGLQALEHFQTVTPDTIVIMVSAVDDIRVGLDAIRKGAYDYLVKPFQTQQLYYAVNRARELRELRTRSRRQDDFLNVISHQLRSPLQGPQSAIDGLLRGVYGPVREEQRDPLLRALRGITTESRLVNNLLDLRYMESGRFSLARDKCSLGRVVEELIDSLQTNINEKDIVVLWNNRAGEASAFGDVDHLKQAFWNIFTNAIDHSPKGGRILIELSRQSSEYILSFTDSGEGIPRAYLDKVFEQGFQVPAKGGRWKKGLGIGLYVSREIIRAHGGRIEVESTLYRGSTFTITVPSNPNSAESTHGTEDQNSTRR